MRFDRDKWFSNENRKLLRKRAYQDSSGTRRVISLGLLLAMILAVMQQLTDPAKYEPAFRAIGLAPIQTPNGHLQKVVSNEKVLAKNGDSVIESQENGKAIEDKSIALESLALAASDQKVDEYAQMWGALLQSATPEVINELSERYFFDERSAQNGASDSLKIENVSETTRLWLIQANERAGRWPEDQGGDQDLDKKTIATDISSSSESEPTTETAIKLFLSQWNAWSALTDGGVPSAAAALSNEVREGLRLSLDRKLLKSVRDASPWRPVERPAMLRTLQRALEANRYCKEDDEAARIRIAMELELIPRVEVPLLIKQPNELRGRLIRMRGRPLSNATSTESKSDRWGNFAYDVVWIYPEDSSQQPVCLYSLKSNNFSSSPVGGWPVLKPDQVGKVNANSLSVEVTGFFLKRLAFASLRGVDIAPVLVVCNSRWIDDDEARPNHPTQAIGKVDSGSGLSLLGRTSSPMNGWHEPGIHRAQLELLNQVLAEPLIGISEETQKTIVSANFSTKEFSQDPEPLESILKVMYQIPRVLRTIHGAISSNGVVGPAKLKSVRGIATQCITIPLLESQAISIGQKAIYRLRVELNESLESGRPNKIAYAMVNRVPDTWLAPRETTGNLENDLDSSIWQPVILNGLILNETSTDTNLLLSDAPMWSWNKERDFLPNSTETIEKLLPKIPADWFQLGAVGWDLSAVRFVKSQAKKPIAAEESEAFYSLIHAASQLGESRTDESAESNTLATITAMECLQGGPKSLLGRVATKIRIVRVTRIDVPEEINRQNLNGTEFYELDGLADIGQQVVSLKNPDGVGDIRFAGKFPMTLVTKSVPDWLLTKSADSAQHDLQQGTWYPSTNIRIEGVFYRLWSYSTGQTAKASEKVDGAELRQIGPLVAVTKWERIASDNATPAPSRSFVREVFTALAIASAGIWFFYRYQFRSIRKRR